MITQTTPLTPSQAASCMSMWMNGSNFYGIQQADLNSASLPAGVTGDPTGSIKQVSGPFTVPAKYFGVHCTTASVATLGAAGAGVGRIHSQPVNGTDYGMAWGNMVANATKPPLASRRRRP